MSAAVSIRKQLPWRRQMANYSAQRLADAAGNGLTRSVIANIESGRKEGMTVDQLIAVCRVLGCNATDLVPDLASVVPIAEDVQELRGRLSRILSIAAVAEQTRGFEERPSVPTTEES